MNKVLSYFNWGAVIAIVLHYFITHFIWHVNWFVSIILFIILFFLCDRVYDYYQKQSHEGSQK
ncbi:unnamed protein product [Fructobacillus tropaeoli]|nr:hypothetical protein FEFB_15900 [Fructobacillus sp. EFB-N1]CAK1234428.1 unnamed protein product [Fructobacillus tropaeoli]